MASVDTRQRGIAAMRYESFQQRQPSYPCCIDPDLLTQINLATQVLKKLLYQPTGAVKVTPEAHM